MRHILAPMQRANLRAYAMRQFLGSALHRRMGEARPGLCKGDDDERA